MTIDAGWVSMLKSKVPAAFTANCPVRPNVVFIDGQIKLMKSDAIRSWGSFVEFQFKRTVDNAFKTGARVVVLGFDNYVHVPTAKNMTQRKRMQDVQALEFTAESELPNAIPENWNAAIKNRVFKTKVIGLVMRSLRAKFEHEAGGTLILDYMGAPEVLGRPLKLPSMFQLPQSLEPKESIQSTETVLKRGECDIKAFSWADLGPLLIESTDGDFVALGLLQTHTTRRIILHRIKTNLKVAGSAPPIAKPKREFEYVDVTMLHEFLRRDEHLSLTAPVDTGMDIDDTIAPEDTTVAVVETEAPKTLAKADPVAAFAALVAMTGCDFCMNLPMLGPTRLWGLRQHAKHLDMSSERGQLVFITLVLADVNAKALKKAGQHSAICKRALRSSTAVEAAETYHLLHTTMLRQTTVAERTRKSLWSRARMRAHVRNTMWTMQYWRRLHEFEDPLAGDNGFERHKNHVIFSGC